VKLPLEIVGVVVQLQEPEHVEDMLEEPARFLPFGPSVKILGDQEHDPHEPAVNERQGQGKEEDHQFVHLEPEDLERFR